MSRKRKFFVAFWLDDDEFLSMKAKISRTSLNQSTYIRKCILEKEMTIIPGIRDLIIEIKRIGNNLNQITRSVNEGSIKILGDDLADIKEDLKKVWEQLAATLKKI
jgi:translation initiation factor 1 (eIF-1/SUI1)